MLKRLGYRICSAFLCLFIIVQLCTVASGASFKSRLDFELDDKALIRAIVVFDGNCDGAALQKAIEEDYNAETVFCYSALFNGVAVDTDYGTLKEIEKHDGVATVYLANRYAAPKATAGNAAAYKSAAAFAGSNAGGSGTVIAVLDTGITVGHEAFTPSKVPADAALNKTKVNFCKASFGLNGAYLNQKIPYTCDYTTGLADISPADSHGTAVASVAAGNNGADFTGAAPNAQILGMKVFNSNGYTDSSIYFAAMEEAYLLGADVINLSLGSQNGFSFDYELETQLYGNIFKKLKDEGVFVFCAAGNEASEGYKSYAMNHYTAAKHVDAVTAGYADYGVLNNPASYTDSIAVACATDSGDYLCVSDFSCWGVTPSLDLKPEITAVGENVICAHDGADNYAYYSGTSIATPAISGAFAAIKSDMLKETANYTDAELYDTIYDRVLSSATPIYDDIGIPCSPRRQGGGIPNYTSFTAAVAAFDEPVMSIGDDPAKSGTFKFKTVLEKEADKALTFSLGKAYTLCDKHVSYGGAYYNTLTSRALEATVAVSADLSSSNGVYTVPKGVKRVELTFTVTLKQAALDYLAAYVNGGFVEGYIYLNLNGKSNVIKQTFMGFYGDWCAAPAFEAHDWDAVVNAMADLDKDGKDPNRYTEMLDMDVGFNEGYLSNGEELIGYLGDNLYDWIEFDSSRMAFASAGNNGNCLSDSFTFYPSLLRNVKQITMTVSDAKTGDVYYVDNTIYGVKNFYDTAEGAFLQGTYFTWDGSCYDGNGNTVYVEDGTKLKVTFETLLEYENAVPVCEREYYIYVDNTAPVLQYEWDAKTRKLTVRSCDNRYISNLFVYTGEYDNMLYQTAITDSKPNDYIEVTIDLSAVDFGTEDSFYLEVQDYATNYKSVKIEVGEGFTTIIQGIKGDVNLDGKVNSLDAAYVLRYDASICELSEKQLANGDVNGDGRVSSLDAAQILKLDAGIIKKF